MTPHRTDEVVLRELYPELRRFAAVVGPAEVGPDDLLHDAIVAVLRGGHLDRFDEPLRYLRRTIVNLAANHRRRFGRRRAALRLVADSTDGAAVDHYPTDLADLAALDPRQRAVLHLRVVEGLDYPTIAHELDISEANARQLVSRATKRLRLHLEEDRS